VPTLQYYAPINHPHKLGLKLNIYLVGCQKRFTYFDQIPTEIEINSLDDVHLIPVITY
jgi:hypothetical protein